MILTPADYTPATHASKATLLSVIAGAHVLAVAALLSIHGPALMAASAPILVQLLPDTPPMRPSPPPRTIPLPHFRPPDIRVPTPPIENLYQLRPAEQPAPVQHEPAPVAAVPTQGPAVPANEAPRFDLAYLNNPAPPYPATSKRNGERGRVMLRVRVDASGAVEAIEVQASSGFARLDEAAVAAVRRWRFVPARSGGATVAGWALVPIHFQLST